MSKKGHQNAKSIKYHRKHSLYGYEDEIGKDCPMPKLKVPRGTNIPTHDYRGVLGLSFRGKH